MSNELVRVFNNNEFGQVRTLMIDSVPWFVGKDVAVALGYTNPRKAIRDHIDEEDKTGNESFLVNGTKGLLINESGLYSLIFGSKLPAAKKFKRWVTSEVLPAIRQNGGYGNALPPINSKLMYDIGDTMKALELENATLTLQIAKAKEVAEARYFTPNKEGNYTVSTIAYNYGMTAQQLNNILREKGIQYKDDDTGKWRLTPEYQNKGYEHIRSYYNRPVGSMSWTPEGLEFLKERMACWGYPFRQN